MLPSACEEPPTTGGEFDAWNLSCLQRFFLWNCYALIVNNFEEYSYLVKMLVILCELNWEMKWRLFHLGKYVCVWWGRQGGGRAGNTSLEPENAESKCILGIYLYYSQLASRSKNKEDFIHQVLWPFSDVSGLVIDAADWVIQGSTRWSLMCKQISFRSCYLYLPYSESSG